MRFNLFLLVLFFVFFFFASSAFPDDKPFDTPANWGGTGLMETPTARILDEGRFRVGFSQADPYRYYYGAISPLKELEINGTITETLGVPALTADYGNTKDKSVGFKFQMIPEGKYTPAIAFGIIDPHGTRKYASQYIAVSKQIYPFDFTIGLGNGRYGKKILPSQGEGIKIEMFDDPYEWLSDSQIFGGIQLILPWKCALMVEYSPIRYHLQTNDSAQKKYFQEPVSSKYNLGFRWKPLEWTEIALSYQRGNQFGINFSVAFDIEKPFIPIYDHPYKERPEYKSDPISERIERGLYASGFSDIGITMISDELWVDAENDRYYYSGRAIRIALSIIADAAPQNIRKIHLALKTNGIPIIEYVTLRQDLIDYFDEILTVDELFYLSEIKTDILNISEGRKKYKKFFSYGLKPSFQTFLNDPSGFFKYKLGLSGWSSYKPWDGASITAGLSGYPLNTVSTSNKPLSIPIRSDIVSYQKKNVALERLMFDQIKKIEHNIYLRGSAGLLEVQYAGIDGEMALPLFDGKLLLGFGGSIVKKREPGKPFGIKNDPVKNYYSTIFINTQLNIPEKEVSIALKFGKFLAGDNGAKITVSKFFNGVILSAWYSMTNTDNFSDVYNRGYHEKGIAVTIPIRFFKGHDSKSSYTVGISPWTRDVAQDIDHFNSLFDFIGRNSKVYLDKDKKRFHRVN